MKDTGFTVAAKDESRLVTVYRKAPDGLHKPDSPLPIPTTYFSGAGGLISTAEDYLRFAQMLVNGGQLGGKRILSPWTVDLMLSNQVGDLFNEGKTGFGLGFEILENPGKGGVIGSPGVFSWGGAYHTVYWADPKEKLAAVLMTQLLPSGGSDLNDKFRVLVYQSIVGPPVTAPAHR
jgi:CubicO group peptidase (beta-lactamase class C family)